jgi:hypothetical protein
MAPPKPAGLIPAGSVGNADPITCADWKQPPSSFLEDDRECKAIRAVGMAYCGCPEPCHFCGEGYRVSNPIYPVRDVQNLLDSVVGPFEEEGGGPTCRDVSNAAAIASALYSISKSSSSDLDYGIDNGTANEVDGAFICELYKLSFASECTCLKVSTSTNGRQRCDICGDEGYADATKSIQVFADGVSLLTTCANVDTFALLGLGICSGVTTSDCPCAKDSAALNSIAIADTAKDASSTSSGTEHFDAVGVSLAVSTMIVILASIL